MTNINWQPEILEDDVVKIVKLSESDFDTLFNVASDPKIWEQHPSKDRYKKEVFQKFFDGAISGKTAFKIIEKASGKLIGSTRYYDFNQDKNSIAIGYTFLAKEYWGGVYNSSTKKLLIDYAFQFVDKVYFHIGTENIRSQKAIEKIGAKKIGVVDFDYYGGKLLHCEYLISRQ